MNPKLIQIFHYLYSMNYANGTRNVDWLTKIKLEGVGIFAKVSSENANLKYQKKSYANVYVVQWTGAG